MWIKIKDKDYIRLINLKNMINIELDISEREYDDDDEDDDDDCCCIVFNTNDNDIDYKVDSKKKAIRLLQMIEDAININYSKVLVLDDLLNFKTFDDFVKDEKD